MFDTSPADDADNWDACLYMDQTNPDFPTYGANGTAFGRSVYIVTSSLNGKDTDVYEGTDYATAERLAISAFERSFRKAYVSVDTDGGTWKAVFAYPRHIDTPPMVIDAGSCPDPRCGEVNPLECWCRYSMTPESIERFKAYY
ncbi:hypothetical protein [Streptomyces sp. NPDC001422]|uniref:hypothetical protein n=1 Tax=Streptomyces sp. NPDC001422 TaxID=3364575 RepID=UPI0036A0AA72